MKRIQVLVGDLGCEIVARKKDTKMLRDRDAGQPAQALPLPVEKEASSAPTIEPDASSTKFEKPDELASSVIALAPIARLLLKPDEAAAALGISARLLWSKTKTGEIPCLRIGKAMRYSPAALKQWIDEYVAAK